MLLLSSSDFKKKFKNFSIRLSNGSKSNQDRHVVRPDLGTINLEVFTRFLFS